MRWSPAPPTNGWRSDRSSIPTIRSFLNPTDMPATIAEYCRMTGQPEPDAPIAYARAILESLAFKYRAVLESLEELTGRRFDEIRIVGGGARNRLLKQWTADATGRTVTAGPAEATALGNIGLQMMATGAVGSLVGGARGDRSIVPGRAVRAARRRSVGRRISPLSTIRGVHLCLRRPRRPPSTCATSGTRRRPPGCRRIRSSSSATDRTCSAPICASPTSAAAIRARNSRCRIR